MATVNFTVGDVKTELRKRISDLDKYVFSFELSGRIIYVGAGEYGGTSVDTGGKTFEEVTNELVPRVVGLIEVCKERSR